LHKHSRDDRDSFQLHLGNIMSQAFGDAAAASVSVELLSVGGNDVCRVHVHPSAFPVDASVWVDVKGKLVKQPGFYVRVGNATKKLNAAEREKYIAGRWALGAKP
jgi:hypothetical protein